MTAQNSFRGKPSAFDGSIFDDRLSGIFTTRRSVSAIWAEPWRNGILIEPDERQEDLFKDAGESLPDSDERHSGFVHQRPL